MDGGARQDEVAEQLKREVREKAHHRRGERAAQVTPELHASGSEVNLPVPPQTLPRVSASLPRDLLEATAEVRIDGARGCPKASTARLQTAVDCRLDGKEARDPSISFSRSDTVLLMFYLDHVLPFLFPFYRPSAGQGGKAWILEMMISSPVVRQATLCQSSYFFSLSRTTTNHDVVWETVLAQTKDAFGALEQSLQLINVSNFAEHLHGAVRILASIMQVQRFEVAVLSFNNCYVHLGAALALFRQLLDSSGTAEAAGASSSFNAVVRSLGPPSWVLPAQSVLIPSAEQAAFRFSSALLILDDIVASTVLQEQPRLVESHNSLLCGVDDNGPPIDLEAAVGCQNWALLHVGQIAVLDAWKQQCKRAGDLDVMELVHRATAIKDSLEAHLTRLEENPTTAPAEGSSFLDAFTYDCGQQSVVPASQSSMVTRVWAHAALLYLFVVVSGWQPASATVRYHVHRIIDLLIRQISPPALLRTMVWPFCVAGCLAEPAQEAGLRAMVGTLQPPSVFGTVRKALEMMENAWRDRQVGDATDRDLATYLRSQDGLVLLV